MPAGCGGGALPAATGDAWTGCDGCATVFMPSVVAQRPTREAASMGMFFCFCFSFRVWLVAAAAAAAADLRARPFDGATYYTYMYEDTSEAVCATAANCFILTFQFGPFSLRRQRLRVDDGARVHKVRRRRTVAPVLAVIHWPRRLCDLCKPRRASASASASSLTARAAASQRYGDTTFVPRRNDEPPAVHTWTRTQPRAGGLLPLQKATRCQAHALALALRIRPSLETR